MDYFIIYNTIVEKSGVDRGDNIFDVSSPVQTHRE